MLFIMNERFIEAIRRMNKNQRLEKHFGRYINGTMSADQF